MTKPVLKALVVDDEAVSRLAVSFALEQDGFDCTLADNGSEAWEKACSTRFDVVITDLCMPVRHGHSLATDLLAQNDRPLVVVHTGIDDPRLTDDLKARGVDDVIHKPTNYLNLAARLRLLAATRRQETGEALTFTSPQKSIPKETPAAIDAFFAALDDNSDMKRLLQNVMQDAAMKEQLFLLANSVSFRRNGNDTTDAMVAVRRIGMKNLAELALQQLPGSNSKFVMEFYDERRNRSTGRNAIWEQPVPMQLMSTHSQQRDMGFPIDINTFVQQCSGNSEFAMRLLDRFTNSAADRIRELTIASDAAALGELALMAHAIKGVAGIFVAQKLYELCRDLEGAALADDLAGSRQLVGMLCDELRSFTLYFSTIRQQMCGL